MIVTLDFVCIRLHPESRAPEVLLRKRETSPEPGSYGLVGGWIREQSQGRSSHRSSHRPRSGLRSQAKEETAASMMLCIVSCATRWG